MVEKRFEKLGMPDIERFENYLPTAFNSELTLLQKVNKIIFDLIETNKLTNEMVDYLNNFVETFDVNLYETLDDVLNAWLEDGKLIKFVRETINDEVVLARDGATTLGDRLDNDKAKFEMDMNKKVGGGVLASMADMGQDIKSAMTGGSVAVVGDGSVNNTSINNAQITPEKNTLEITINKTDLPIRNVGYYINNEGVLVESATFNVREYIVPKESKSITFNSQNSLTYLGAILYDDLTVRPLSRGATQSPHLCKILLNEVIGTASGIDSLTVKFHDDGYLTPEIFNVVSGDSLHGNGYIANNEVNFTPTYSHYKIPILKGYRYKAVLTANVGLYGCTYDKNNNYLGNITLKNGYLVLSENISYILVNIKDGDTLYAEKIESDNVFLFSSSLNKPYSFDGKNAIFFGDSITQGVTESVVTTNGFPKLFCDKVGMTFVNAGVGGSLFTSGLNEQQTILEKMQTYSLSNRDVVFIGGGTNDFGLGADIVSFKQAVKDVCIYLSQNYDGEVIFITPINRTRPSNNEVANLNVYRQIISELALSNGYSVIDGSKFSFPTLIGDYQTKVMPDGIHPSELGYRIYANDLTTVLL